MSYCTDCIHYKVCGNEGVDDSAMTFCVDKQTDGDLISRTDLLNELEKWDWQDTYLPIHFKELVDELPSAEKTALQNEDNCPYLECPLGGAEND